MVIFVVLDMKSNTEISTLHGFSQKIYICCRKNRKKTCSLTQKWLKHLLFITSYLVTIEADLTALPPPPPHTHLVCVRVNSRKGSSPSEMCLKIFRSVASRSCFELLFYEWTIHLTLTGSCIRSPKLNQMNTWMAKFNIQNQFQIEARFVGFLWSRKTHEFNELFNYLTHHNLLTKNQSGFRKYHAGQSLLIKLADFLLGSIDSGMIAGLTMRDSRKKTLILLITKYSSRS